MRVTTKIGKDGIVRTLQVTQGDWTTIVSGPDTGFVVTTADAVEAGKTHLRYAYDLRELLMPAKTWHERAERDDGFIDDDMGCRGDWD